jgi:fucose permease
MKRLELLGYFVFITLGINVAILGPALQTLSERTGAGIAELGYLFATMSVGYLASAPVIGSLRINASLRPLLSAAGLIVVSLWLFTVATTLWMVLAAALLLGFGQACTQVGFITLIGTQMRSEGDSGSRLNRVNAFFGVGALVGPLLVALSYRQFGGALPAFWAAMVMDLLLLAMALRMRLPAAVVAEEGAPRAMSDGALLRTPAMLALVAMMAVYVGAEVAFSSWTTEFTRLAANVDVASASLASSVFFGGLAFSRYFAAVLLSRTSLLRALFAMLGVAACGVGLMLAPFSPYVVVLIGSMIVGVGYGPVYPTLVSAAIARFPREARSVSSLVTSAGSFGAVLIPALTGNVIEGANGLSLAWGMQLASIALMLAMLVGMRRSLLAAPEAPRPERRPAPAEPS